MQVSYLYNNKKNNKKNKTTMATMKILTLPVPFPTPFPYISRPKNNLLITSHLLLQLLSSSPPWTYPSKAPEEKTSRPRNGAWGAKLASPRDSHHAARRGAPSAAGREDRWLQSWWLWGRSSRPIRRRRPTSCSMRRRSISSCSRPRWWFCRSWWSFTARERRSWCHEQCNLPSSYQKHYIFDSQLK